MSFLDAEIPVEQAETLLREGQVEALKRGRGCVVWLEGDPVRRYLVAADVGRAPLSEQARDDLRHLIATYPLATAIVLVRLNAAGSASIVQLASKKAPRAGVRDIDRPS